MIQLAGLLSLLVFLPLLFFLKHLMIFEASAKLPPGPNACQVLLNISKFRNKPHVVFHDLAKIYGPLFSMRLGGRLIVVASSPATAKGLLIAGGDSGLVTTIWLMVELMRNQNILSRVRQEIAEAMGTKTATIDDSILSTCEYFQACVKETLRLHVPGPLLVPHQTLENCVLDDYRIPKDSIVLVNAWAIQLDPGNWKDATSFKPDRFLGSKVDFRGNSFEFIPFGSGRRMCPGYQMGFRNVQLVVACLIHYFDWSLPDGKNPENLDTADVLRAGGLRREKPLLMIPRLREKCVV